MLTFDLIQQIFDDIILSTKTLNYFYLIESEIFTIFFTRNNS